MATQIRTPNYYIIYASKRGRPSHRFFTTRKAEATAIANRYHKEGFSIVARTYKNIKK